MQSVLEGIARRVSVPLRGKGRDQRKDKTSQALRPLAFPSPCGEKVGINYYWNYSQNRWVRFPSPCGEKVGINSQARWSLKQLNAVDAVSVPLRGKGRDQPH